MKIRLLSIPRDLTLKMEVPKLTRKKVTNGFFRFSFQFQNSLSFSGVFFPFGDGPRICPGMRFAVVQSKVALAYLVRNYEITLNSKTGKTFEIHPQAIVAQNTTPYLINLKEYVKSEK